MIFSVDENNYKEVYDFLKTVPTINSIEEDILKNAVFIKEKEGILGIISFEKFDKYGLIRYFVFKKNVEIENINELIEAIYHRANKKNINNLILIATTKEMKEMFEDLGFCEYDKKMFFIEEKNICNTRYKDTYIMVRNICCLS